MNAYNDAMYKLDGALELAAWRLAGMRDALSEYDRRLIDFRLSPDMPPTDG